MIYTLGERRVQMRGRGHYIAPNAVVVGSVILEQQVSIWFNVVIRGDNEDIVLGPRSNIQDGSVLHTDEGVPLSVGASVSVGHLAMLHGCLIGEGSLIGIKAVILNNAVIGKECLIGANTLIAEGKTIPDRSLVIGSPGKVVRTLTAEEVARLRWVADHYVENAERYRRGLTVA
ncbi:MAG TPA: gamma carbonic anhydrase family protein [Casimicrobiaceae bacterium]|jgi:carbonic anhydrase/acetyltransferase-like protein (isoleucine patch superfamily)|nr:gamma carbonic anhydrase family protein [Casimicrobiaceae bacterium]